MAKKKSATKTYKEKWDAANKEAKKDRAAATKGKKAPPKPN